MVIWIAGGGAFGSRAAKLMTETRPEASLTLVDSDTKTLKPWQGRIETVAQDAVEFLVRNLGRPIVPDWVVAAVPVHLAWEWLVRVIPEALVPREVPFLLAERLPHPLQGPHGELFVSHAASMCPADCPEPPDICPATGQPREPHMYDVIARAIGPEYDALVIPSQKLAPGVGGCRGRDFIRVLERVRNGSKPLILATACPCQGVIHCADRTTENRKAP